MKQFELGQITKQGILIQSSLKLIEELATNELADIDSDEFSEEDSNNIDKLKTLIIKARGITSDYLFNELK